MKIKYAKVLSVLIILASIYYSFYGLLPSKITDEETPLTEFSTQRALVHLEKISQKAHFVGTEEHTKVRHYLIEQLKKLGLEPSVQEQFSVNKKWKAAANTVNVLARIKGTDKHAKALLLLTHYDSAVHSSLGASDAGSGVVTILESVRAFLAQNKTPKNDIIIMFSDAEELGLLGANAFVNYHPWAKEVGLVLNFEARGSGGPSYMLLETNGGNKELIHAFNKAKPNYPVANSLMYSIYKMLPNDTDLTVFREEGNINGFNFAFIDDHFDYHTSQDNFENLDRNTLEHQGDYLSTLLPYFANTNLENLNAKTDNVYFSMGTGKLNTFPFSYVFPLFFVAFALFLIILVLGIKKNKLHVKEIFIGFIPFFMSLIASVGITFLGWKIINFIHPQYKEILHGFTYNGHWYILGFSILSLAVLFCIYKKYFTTYKVQNLFIAPIVFWLIINLLVAIYLKGAGFFILPVFAAVISLAVLLFVSKKEKSKLVFYSLISIPTLLIFVPLIQMFPVGLGLKMLPLSTLFITLLFGLLLLVFEEYGMAKKLSMLFLIVSLIAFVNASLKADYNKERKKPTSLVYVLDSDKQEAYWASYERETNPFNEEYLTKNPTKGSFTKTTTASKYNTTFKTYKKTEKIALAEPSITTILDSISGKDRLVHLKIKSNRLANRIEILAKDTLQFKSFSINGVDLKKVEGKDFIFETKKRKTMLSYYLTKPNEVIDLKYTVPTKNKPSIEIMEVKYDLFTNPLLNVKNRENSKYMPTPFVINDATIITKEITFKDE